MSRSTRRRLRILVLMQPELIPPDSVEGMSERDLYEIKTEYDVLRTLRAQGHDVRALGVRYELLPIREAVEEWKPHVVFNLLEDFFGLREFDHHVVSYLELLRVPYTGCNPRGLVLSRDKALSKKVLAYHRLALPRFDVVRRGRRVRRSRLLTFPLIVKSLNEEGSVGIAQASVVNSDAELTARVEFVHRSIESDAIIEEYIDGREIYIGIVGNDRLAVFPPWELFFEKPAPGARLIATSRVKHNLLHQERRGIFQGPAELSDELRHKLVSNARRIYRLLSLDGYARLDFRLRADGTPFFIEANPNPEVAESEEFASSALEAGIAYSELLARIVSLGVRRGRKG
ncbi:MAG: D-alanine--D-alanine ligase [Gemmatimonadaceae bacterium]|nr:D-alanine--D-alanine ligase [Gemmatimonadaceae bacterium]